LRNFYPNGTSSIRFGQFLSERRLGHPKGAIFDFWARKQQIMTWRTLLGPITHLFDVSAAGKG
jgi:hypothetical protein